jgi:hypothetical protein
LRQTNPADVWKPYRALIDAQLLDSYDKHRYDNAITLLRRLREAYAATGETAQFDAQNTGAGRLSLPSSTLSDSSPTGRVYVRGSPHRR